MKTTESNKLIAEFMGAIEEHGEYDLYSTTELNEIFVDVDNQDQDAKHFFHPEEMKFHSSWDWLMPVIQEIEKKTNCSMVMGSGYSYWRDKEGIEIEVSSESTGGYWKIDNIYNSVISFIQWYIDKDTQYCAKYPDSEVLPNEEGNCSLCDGDCTNQIQ